MNFLADIIASIGTMAADNGTKACSYLFIDEPKMPKCLLEK